MPMPGWSGSTPPRRATCRAWSRCSPPPTCPSAATHPGGHPVARLLPERAPVRIRGSDGPPHRRDRGGRARRDAIFRRRCGGGGGGRLRASADGGRTAAATAAGAPRVFEGWPDNVAGPSSAQVGEPAVALGTAEVVVEVDLDLARVAGAPLEPRGIVVVPEGPDGRFTIWIPSQSPYGLRGAIAGALDLPEERVRIICTDSAGGFGIKGHTYAEDIILAAAARRLGRTRDGRSRGGSISSAARRIEASVTTPDLEWTAKGASWPSRRPSPATTAPIFRSRGDHAEHHQPSARTLPRADLVASGRTWSPTPSSAAPIVGRDVRRRLS